MFRLALPSSGLRFAVRLALAVCVSSSLLAPSAPVGAQDDSAEIELLSLEELQATALFDLPATSWFTPPIIESSGGELHATLHARMSRHLVRDHEDKRQVLDLRSYNGGLVGPTLKFRAGDRLFVHLRNDLPANEGQPSDPDAAAAAHHAAMQECPNVPHDFNTTNLHTHGLHISPRAPADDVNLSIQPEGGTFDYVFPILPAGNPPGQPPGQHYPGTFWYHAHRHGSTAIQLASGMAGALLLMGDLDELPEIKSANERLFVLQQIAYGADGTISDFGSVRPNWLNVVKEHTRINGRLKPKFTLRPGQIERWRLIDSGVFADVPLHVVPQAGGRPVPLFQIAADGITFPSTRIVHQLDLYPGYRADVLFQAPTTPGTYYIRKKKSAFDLTGRDGESTADAQVLAVIEVEGRNCRRNEAGCGYGIPTELPAPTGMLPTITTGEVQARKIIKFSEEGRNPTKFLIEDKCYEPGLLMPKFDVKLNGVEQWTLVNTSEFPHPFHIHVNAFQIWDGDRPGIWRDTVVIPPGGQVVIRTRFERFDGAFVTHCHILTHEDLGMMQNVRIRK